MVVDNEPRPGRNGMKSSSKYSMLHAKARYNRHWCIILQFHCTMYPNMKFSIFSPEYRYRYYYSLDTSTDINPIEKANGSEKTQLNKYNCHDYIHKVHNETYTFKQKISPWNLWDIKENSWCRHIQNTHRKTLHYTHIQLSAFMFELNKWVREERRTWGRYTHPQRQASLKLQIHSNHW